jgi:hypothetical protein
LFLCAILQKRLFPAIVLALGKVMSDNRTAVLRKFAGLVRAPDLTRRPDYKGPRWRLNLRLDEDVAADLQIIKVVSGVPKNTFCQNVLREAIRNRVRELQAEHDAAAWETVIKLAKAGKG